MLDTAAPTAPPKRFVFTEEHEELRRSIRAFVDREIAPHVDEWEETTFPDAIVRRMGELGFLGLSVPEAYGGQGGGYFPHLILAGGMGRSRCGGGPLGPVGPPPPGLPPPPPVRRPGEQRGR